MERAPRRGRDSPRLTRREALRLGAVALAGTAYALACGGSEGPRAAATPGAASPWRRLAASGDVPEARKDHSLAVDEAGGRVYLFGGRSSFQPQGDLWQYDLGANRWRRLAPEGDAPRPRFGHNAAFDAARGRLIIFGGQAGSDFFRDLWAFDVAAGRWTRLADTGPAPRYGAGGAYDGDRSLLFVSHGFTDQGRFDDTWQYALGGAGWTDVSPKEGRPLKRCLHRATWDPASRSVLLFGGQSNAAAWHDDLWRFDPATGAWREITARPRPSPRNLYAAAYDAAGRRLLVVGGSTQGGPEDDVWAFTAAGAWVKLDAPGLPARSAHDAVYLSARRSLLVFGGAGASGELNDLWELALG